MKVVSRLTSQYFSTDQPLFSCDRSPSFKNLKFLFFGFFVILIVFFFTFNVRNNMSRELSVEKNNVQKECEEAEKEALKQKLVHIQAKLKLNDVEKECQEAEAIALDKNLVHMEAKLKLNDVQKECQEAEAAALKQNLVHMKKKIKLNDVQKECQEAEAAALKKKLGHIEAKLKLTEQSNDAPLGINSLPNEMILKIFGYLEQNQLGQIARVCKRWSLLTKSPALWERVDVKFHWSHKSQITVTNYFVSRLPPCVTAIRLFYKNRDDWTEKLNFEGLCVELQKRCPHLKTLSLEDVILSDSLPVVVDLCSRFLQGLKTLVFHGSKFVDCPAGREFGSNSKIEVLDLGDCDLGQFDRLEFFKIPQLRVLSLKKTWIGPRTFQAVRNHGLNLQELYLCDTYVRNEDMIFDKSVFPHLQKICLYHTCYISAEGIASVAKSCQSLQKLYFGAHASYVGIKALEAHPFFVRNRRKFEILKDGCHANSKN